MTLQHKSGYTVDIDGNVKFGGQKAGRVQRINHVKGIFFSVGDWTYDTECLGGCRRVVGFFRDQDRAAQALLADSHNRLTPSVWQDWNGGRRNG